MSRSRRALASLLLVGIGLPSASHADPSLTEDLGTLERAALARALEARSLRIETEPEGKIIGQVHVVNLDVFQPQDGFLQVFNSLHVTTEEDVIRREVLLRPGMAWDERRVFETKRNLRDRTFTTLVVAVPVRSRRPGHVDLLVVTRDVWSLRLNSRFDLQQDTFRELAFSLSENNFLGRRKRVSLTFDMDLGSVFLGGSFFDSNIRGSRLTLLHTSGVFLARADGAVEGSASRSVFRLPLWALDRRWGFDVQVQHADQRVRSFLGTELRTYDDPATPTVEAVPRVYRRRAVAAELTGTWSIPGPIIHRFGFGYVLSWSEAERDDPGVIDPATEAAFARDVLPRAETRSGLTLRYRLFRPEFRIYRDMNTYDFPEDEQVGPDLRVAVTASPRGLGSTEDTLLFEVDAAWFLDWSDDAYTELNLSASNRLDGQGLVDHLVSGRVITASPTWLDALRLVVQVRGAGLFRESANRFLSRGGEEGLRGFPAGQFTGDRSVIVNAELRTRPLRVAFLAAGAVAFYDGGHAWGIRPGLPSATTAPRLAWQSDVGLGLRAVVPQTDTTVWRMDFALPLTGEAPGWDGFRFSAGLGQFF